MQNSQENTHLCWHLFLSLRLEAPEHLRTTISVYLWTTGPITHVAHPSKLYSIFNSGISFRRIKADFFYMRKVITRYNYFQNFYLSIECLFTFVNYFISCAQHLATNSNNLTLCIDQIKQNVTLRTLQLFLRQALGKNDYISLDSRLKLSNFAIKLIYGTA